ncbi:MAG: ATP-dependent 6-phosphofructokinase [Acidimicrobiia bacterium]|nr:ATP-dependent 6-phosphofructokinase [Acidimicrobiia bacterium]MDX2468393.1 ATP-dependent 6-phosphofructokinase [Acidimicrobiia bacterium]
MPVIGVLTAGGDCPGLNAAIRAVTARVVSQPDAEVVGIKNGWEGLMEDDTIPLDRDAVRGILMRGGTILGTSRMDPYVHGDGYASCEKTINRNGIDSLVVIGGDGTLRSALRLSEEGLPVIGVPKTIDNDIAGTDTTFGFSTAVQIATEAIDRLASTAESHNRVIVVEVMGRTKGWIAAYAGIAGGADAILIPEVPYDLEEIADIVRLRHRRGQRYSIVVVAEGVTPPPGVKTTKARKDAFGFDRLGGVGYRVADQLEEMTGFETRVSVLGHIQRGGTPSAFDRVLATRLGVAAADYALAGKNGVMAAVRGSEIVPVSIEEACASIRGVPQDLFDTASTFFG